MEWRIYLTGGKVDKEEGRRNKGGAFVVDTKDKGGVTRKRSHCYDIVSETNTTYIALMHSIDQFRRV